MVIDYCVQFVRGCSTYKISSKSKQESSGNIDGEGVAMAKEQKDHLDRLRKLHEQYRKRRIKCRL